MGDQGPDRAYLPPRKHRLVEQLSEQPSRRVCTPPPASDAARPVARYAPSGRCRFGLPRLGAEQADPALGRAVAFRRWRADDVRSILAAAGAAPDPRPAGQALVLTLPTVPTRPLSDYAVLSDYAIDLAGGGETS